MTQTRWPPTPYHLCHCQNFDKIDSLLKPVLNICNLGNLIVRWGGWVIKEGAGILYQIFRFNIYLFFLIFWHAKIPPSFRSGGVNIWGKIHEIKSWYSLESSHTSKVRPLSYRNQSIDLRCKSMDWFLYDNGRNCFRL